MYTLEIHDTAEMATIPHLRMMAEIDRVMRPGMVVYDGHATTVHIGPDALGQCGHCRSADLRTVRAIMHAHGHYARVAWHVEGWPTDEPCARHRMALALTRG